MEGYRTKPSDIHITSPRDLYSSTLPGGTSCPTTVPSQSTISIVTDEGRGKRESQERANTVPLHDAETSPGTSRGIPPETLPIERSMSSTAATSASCRMDVSTTPTDARRAVSKSYAEAMTQVSPHG